MPCILALGLIGLVMSDRAARGSAEDAVTAGKVPDGTAHHGAFEAALGVDRHRGAGTMAAHATIVFIAKSPLAPDR